MESAADHGPEVLAICWTFTTLAVLAVALRILLRTKFSSLSGRDDIAIVVSLLFSLIYTSVCTAAVVLGAGQHRVDIPPRQLPHTLKLLTISPALACAAFSTPKLAVTFLIVRIFEPPRWHRTLLYSLCSLVLITSSINIILVFVQCSPPAALWNPAVKPNCWPPSVVIDYSIFTSALSAFADFCLAVYPVTRLAKLQMSRQRKITIGILFSLDGLAGIVAIVKCTKLPDLAEVEDLTYASADLLYWSTIEANILIIAASIPALAPLLSRKAFNRWMSNNGLAPPTSRFDNATSLKRTSLKHASDATEVTDVGYAFDASDQLAAQRSSSIQAILGKESAMPHIGVETEDSRTPSGATNVCAG